MTIIAGARNERVAVVGADTLGINGDSKRYASKLQRPYGSKVVFAHCGILQGGTLFREWLELEHTGDFAIERWGVFDWSKAYARFLRWMRDERFFDLHKDRDTLAPYVGLHAIMATPSGLFEASGGTVREIETFFAAGNGEDAARGCYYALRHCMGTRARAKARDPELVIGACVAAAIAFRLRAAATSSSP